MRAKLFGHPVISIGDRVVSDDAWPRRTARSLLLLLLATPQHRLAREQILDALWPDASPESAASALYSALYAVRRTLEPGARAAQSTYVDARGGSVGLRAIPGLVVDTDSFRAALARAESADGADRARALREAVAVYAGDFIADEPYAEWPVALRERFRRDWRRSVLELAQLEREAGRPLAAVQSLEAVLAADPTDEAAHRALITVYASAGQRAEAEKQFARCVAALRSDLDVEPSDETVHLAASINQMAATVAATQPAGRLKPAAPPQPPAPLIGRESELADVSGLLGDGTVRLVTVVGPGGVGKTRLALEIAQEVAGRADTSLAFVSLAAVRDARLVLSTIARALGLEERPGTNVEEQLRETLYGQQLLLIVDNFEHLLDAATDVAKLLEGSPDLRVLATSREALHIRAERVYRLEPLALPDDPSSAASSDAVRLFVDRAVAVAPRFTLTQANVSTIAAICARLEGLPLAIELAAARLRHMDVTELLARLEPALPLLSGGARDLPARLQTMSDAIAWSYDLLTADEQRLLRTLAVFVGGAPPEAIAAVFDRPADDLVNSLADKSLIRTATAAAKRVTMLETIREFAAGRLCPTEAGPLRDRHAAYFLTLAERAEPQLIGPGQAEWLNRLETEHGNLRAAFEHLLVSDVVPDGALRLARALSRFWRIHGHYDEGRSTVRRALERPGPATVARARALITASDLAESQAHFSTGQSLLREATAIFERQGDRDGLAETALGMAAIALGTGDLAGAAQHSDRSAALYREVGNVRGTASALNYLAGVAFHRAEFDEAAAHWQQVLELLARIGDDRGRSIALSNLGVLEIARGEFRRGLDHYLEALATARRLDDVYASTHALVNLGHVYLLLGEHDNARRTLAEGIDRARQMGDPVREAVALHTLGQVELAVGNQSEAAVQLGRALALAHAADDKIRIAGVIDAIAELALTRGNADAAAQLFGAVDALQEAVGAKRLASEHPSYEAAVARTQAALGADEFERARASGSRLAIGEAVAAAQRLVEPLIDR